MKNILSIGSSLKICGYCHQQVHEILCKQKVKDAINKLKGYGSNSWDDALCSLEKELGFEDDKGKI